MTNLTELLQDFYSLLDAVEEETGSLKFSPWQSAHEALIDLAERYSAEAVEALEVRMAEEREERDDPAALLRRLLVLSRTDDRLAGAMPAISSLLRLVEGVGDDSANQ